MPMPIVLDGEWIPLERYCHFEFGSKLDHRGSERYEGLRTRKPRHDPVRSRGVRARYVSDDLDCDLQTVDDLVHWITAREACLFHGFNLIGSKVEAVLSLLEVNAFSWHVPYPTDPLENIGAIPSLGLEVLVMHSTRTVVEVTLRPRLDEYLERERCARGYLGGLVDLLRECPEFEHPSYRFE